VQSVGAKFIDIPVEEDTVAAGGYAKEVSASTQEKIREILTEHVKRSDAIITTAQVPGKRAPLIVTEAMINQMKPGSVIVDLAAEQGGNCAFTEPGKIISHEGVTIIGSLNLPASVPVNASQTYAKNLLTLLQLLVKDGNLALNFEDDIIDGACVAHAGEIRDRRVREALSIPV
jgi:H+-translocating NAD(P) transhydrogenase subunit alpha